MDWGTSALNKGSKNAKYLALRQGDTEELSHSGPSDPKIRYVFLVPLNFPVRWTTI